MARWSLAILVLLAAGTASLGLSPAATPASQRTGLAHARGLVRLAGNGFGKSGGEKKPTKAKGKIAGKIAEAGMLGSEDLLSEDPWRGFSFAGAVRPATQSPPRTVPEEIPRPDYSEDGVPKQKGPRMPWQIEVKSGKDIEGMAAAGRVAREVLDTAARMVQPGITTDAIDALVHEETVKRGAYPSPLNYHGFPKACCTSRNEVICHGIPDASVLQDGDIVNIDVTVYFNGYHGDCSETIMVGEVDERGKDLVQVTYDCWVEAMNFCEPGRPYKDIGAIIQDYVTPLGYTTVKQFCGHGIGSIFHTNPNILHYRNNEPNGIMAVGHTFTIEPMINEGANGVTYWPDKWTATTSDGLRSAQFEHTLLMTETGVVPLTAKTEQSPMYFWERGEFYKGRGTM